MQAVTTIGLDIAKSVFQVHGVDAAGQVVVRRQLKRRAVLAFFQKLPVCLVGIEACASSHYWSRELQALRASEESQLSCAKRAGQLASPRSQEAFLSRGRRKTPPSREWRGFMSGQTRSGPNPVGWSRSSPPHIQLTLFANLIRRVWGLLCIERLPSGLPICRGSFPHIHCRPVHNGLQP